MYPKSRNGPPSPGEGPQKAILENAIRELEWGARRASDPPYHMSY